MILSKSEFEEAQVRMQIWVNRTHKSTGGDRSGAHHTQGGRFGHRFIEPPPSSEPLMRPVTCSTAPMDRNSRPLKITSLKACAIAPLTASAVPIPTTMNPTWLIKDKMAYHCARYENKETRKARISYLFEEIIPYGYAGCSRHRLDDIGSADVPDHPSSSALPDSMLFYVSSVAGHFHNPSEPLDRPSPDHRPPK